MEKVDYFIIGQGLAGTMLAFEMLENNVSFKILTSVEKSKASNVAAGMVNPLVFKRLTKSWMVDELLPVMKTKYTRLENLLGLKFYFEKDILKPLSAQEMLLWRERKTQPEFSKYISKVEITSPVANIRNTAGYGFVTGSGYLDTKLFLDTAEKFFRKQNLIVDSVVSPEKINLKKENFEIAGFHSRKIVFCEGYHIISNPMFQFVQLKPVKGEVLSIYAPNLSEKFTLNKKVFVLPIGDHRFKVGSTYDWNDITEQTTQQGKASIIERLDNLIDTEYSIENHWAGIRPTMADRRPVLGFHPENKNIAVFNGLGTKGVMLAPYFASVMLNVLTVPRYKLIPEISIERFY